MAKLNINMVPQTSWFTNLRSQLKRSDWDWIRRAVYARADNVCEICGGIGRKWPVECHEEWEYDDDSGKQTLVGLAALCPDCHRVQHAGLAQINNETDLVIRQLMKVNKWSRRQALMHHNAAFEEWSRRSLMKWHVVMNPINKTLTSRDISDLRVNYE